MITVKRAYFELEREGVIVTQHGKGSTVARRRPTWARGSTTRSWPDISTEVARLGALLGLSPEELATRLRDAAERLTSGRERRRSTHD